MTIEELFGTLQQSVVATWRKHLRTAKYSKHMALNDFYEEMPEKVDALIEAWMGVNGKKIKSYDNILQSKNMNTLSYLKDLRKVVKEGYTLMDGNAELEALLDDIVELIDSTLYKVKELSESNKVDLKDFLMESLNVITEATNEKQAIKLFQDMYDEDGDLVSLASCFGWLNDLNWKVMNANGYSKYINKEMGIDADMVMWYSERMAAMAQLGKEKTLEIIGDIAEDDEMEDWEVFNE